MAENLKEKCERAAKIDAVLSKRYRNDTALRFENVLQLLVATILSAQCTDARVNMVTPGLFARFPTVADFAAAPPTQGASGQGQRARTAQRAQSGVRAWQVRRP